MMFGHRGGMFGIVTHRQQAAMHHRMQCLNAAVHHFGKARELANVLDCQTRRTQRFGGATCGYQFHMTRSQCVAKFNQPSLVGHRQ